MKVNKTSRKNHELLELERKLERIAELQNQLEIETEMLSEAIASGNHLDKTQCLESIQAIEIEIAGV